MNKYHLLLLLGVNLLIISCKKESSNNSNTVAAATYLNAAYGTDAQQQMDVYLPAGRTAAATKVMILVHGGAWVSGDKADFKNFIDTLKKRLPAYALFNINYRLSAFPANVFPTQELDVKKAVEYIYNKRNEYFISDNFSFIGASAGAHLGLLHAYKYASPVKIKAVIDFFGPTDLEDLYNHPGLIPQSIIDTIVGTSLAGNTELYRQSSPINFVTNVAACPTIILQGSNDLLVNPLRQSAALRDKLLLNSVPVQYVEYAGKGHGDNWYSDTYLDAFNKIQAFLTQYNP